MPARLTPAGGDDDALKAPRPDKKPNGRAHRHCADRSVILLVDDSEQDHTLIAAAMDECGLDGCLRWARSHEEAVAYFEGRPPFDDRTKHPVPSLVLLDIQLPSADGLSLLGWVRSQNAQWHRVPVVMLTTSQRRAEITRAYDLGANSYLVKPTSFAELCDTLKATTDYWLKQNRQS
jgi:DNA-binding response OmpR family regulator